MKGKREAISPLLTIDDPKIEKLVCQRIADYTGLGTTLGSAVGALVVGQHYGTRVLRMMHSPGTYRKYERILGVRFDDLCPESTHLSEKNTGFSVAEKLGAFWDVVMGRNKVEKKGWIENGDSR